ncbi:GNAT family N-acetyltransferase [Paeniglutamicibacter gangotriensis]|uniref:GNAT family N-acetyltransferase n=1 Tax=Paeniglutamicibacter gangotriensis TaxID=254787 RepID=A0A5B0EBQ8_9MICC|nr:GNAT family N-acetyltransferase [Paeniglutamicibacter gangotriensis]KAA0976096.1 GNAT family N-acetyltransferase [Paeniglutamicibacter gangotriensis]
MMTSDALEAAESWTSSQIKNWSPRWRDNLAHWLEPSLALVGDAEWGGQIRDMVQLPVQDPLAWANRRIELSDGHWAIAGIRFRGRDIEKPFVDVFATSLPPEPTGLAALGEILSHFSAFSPLCFRVNLPDPGTGLRTIAASEADAGRATPDLLVVGRPVAEMLEQPLDSRYDEVSLVPCGPAEAQRRVAAIYDELRRAQPQLDQWATPADADTLEDAAEEGLLFDIRVNGTSAGVVAAERDDAYGLAGFCMQEIVLDSAHRGSRVGVAALQRLCHEVPSTTNDVLWGHIHPDNVPSLRNAQASGRKIVTAHVWVTPMGYSGMPV